MKRPSDGKKPEKVVWVQCAGSRSGPERPGAGVEYCSKICCSVSAKQIDRLLAADPTVEPTVVYYRDMRTYERALETLYQKLRITGIEFVNGEIRSIEADASGNLELHVEPFPGKNEAADPIKISADLVVLAAAQSPSSDSERLYRMFGVRTDRYGYPIENQPRLFKPTESMKKAVRSIRDPVGTFYRYGYASSALGQLTKVGNGRSAGDTQQEGGVR